MKSVIKAFLAFYILLVNAGFSNAFTGPKLTTSVSKSVVSSPSSLNMVFGKKKTAAQKAEEEAKLAQYWQGEWVCKDCGYIYQRVRIMEGNGVVCLLVWFL